ncbi:MAG TPA: Na+/H+ antiporter, partial [Blastocatellia bacterium]
ISPELILLIFLPALLFEAAWKLKLDHLRENLLPILTLAILGVGLSVGVIGVILHYGIGFSWSLALLFGAMISATDPVSVLALFKKFGLPGRLTTIVEGESLFNDGTAVVIFRIILGIAIGSGVHSTGGLMMESLREFGLVVFGGLAVGVVIGIISSALTSYFDDHLLEITLTTIAAYGSFLLAESLHVSPVIAVLAAGLIIGNYGRERGMSPTTQVTVNSFWEYAAFVVNSLVFLLIGMEMRIDELAQSLTSIAWAVGAMLVSRLVSVYGLMPLINRYVEKVSLSWQHVLFWGGLRGSLSIALALSLPTSLPGRSQLVVMIFGAVMFSLLGQGLTITRLLKWLGLIQPQPKFREYEILQGKLMAEAAALADLDSLRDQGLVTDRVWQSLREGLAKSREELSHRVAQLDEMEQAQQQHLRRIRRHLIDRKKARLNQLFREGMISESSFNELKSDFDKEIATAQDTSVSVEAGKAGAESD